MRRLWICFLVASVFCIWCPQGNTAASEVRVQLLPLQVFSEQEGREELRVLLERIMAARLMAEEEVHIIHQPGENAPPDGYPLDEVRQLAEARGARWVLWGSITQIGRLLSVDLRLLDVQEMEEPISIYAQALDQDELLALTETEMEKALTRILGLRTVAEIRVEGNRRIGKDAILMRTKVRVGDGYYPHKLKEDIREIDKMGYFEDVQALTEDSPEGKIVIFRIAEKPTVREIVVAGNEEMDTDDIQDVITLQPQSIINYEVLTNTVEKIKKLYQEKGFYAAQVDYQLKDLEGNQKGVIFQIDEGKKFWIKTIDFEGNENLSDKELKKAMETSEKGMLSWLTGSGVLDQETLNQDVERLAAYYYNYGFLRAQVGTPRIKTDDEWIYITIGVTEGDPYTVRSIGFEGELLLDEEVLRQKMRTRVGEPLNRDDLRKDILGLTDYYADLGYAYADVNPESEIHEEDKTVSIVLEIKKNQKVYIGRVRIVGNSKTRDKVIRRELLLSEGDIFASTALKQCTERLEALKYFEEVNLTTTPGATEDIVDLNVEVKEQQTGTFSLGGGYSTVDGLVGVAEIQQTNLFGRGYKVRVKAEIGSRRQFYDVGFIDPWFLDTRWSMRLDAYKLERQYLDYTRGAFGGDIIFGHPLDFVVRGLYGTIGYRGEEIEVKDVDPNASKIFKEAEGTFFTSQVIGALSYDTRNHTYYPTRGNHSELSGFFAGPIGDGQFFKGILSSAWYFPVIWDTSFMVRGEIGYGIGYGGEELPIYERFFLGGLSTLRGFEAGSVGPRDPETGDVIGGDKELFFNFEYMFPIVRKLELRGVLFYDVGNAFLDTIDISDLRHAVGAGVRWFSPFGPIRVEVGWNLDPFPDEDQYEWAFGMGGSF